MKELTFPKEIEHVLRQLPEEHGAYIKDYFQNAPEALLVSMTLESRKANRILVEENDRIEKVYVLLEGYVKAVDFRVKGASYEFAIFGPCTIFGSMETLFGLDRFATTLVTDTDCTLVAMPKVSLESWLMGDANAMRKEAMSMREYLLERTRESRVLMLLNGTERLMYLLTRMCEMQGCREEYLLAVNRQELAERSGSSVKTVNRSIKKLEESEMVLRVGHKVKITQNQYAVMRGCLDKILNFSEK